MNCCEQSGMTCGCNQGRDCPVRAAAAQVAPVGRMYPVPVPEAELPLDVFSVLEWVAVVLLAILSAALVCAGLIYLPFKFGDAVAQFFLALAARLA